MRSLNSSTVMPAQKHFSTEMFFLSRGIISLRMAGRPSFPEHIYEYLTSVSLREPAILRRLREETAAHPTGGMQIPPEHGQFMALLMQLMGARRTLEVGVFTGYSSLCVALALPDDGRIVACDISEEYTSVARRYWKEAGVEDKIDLRIAPALDTLAGVDRAGRQNSFDFAFIDADKTNYANYYDCAHGAGAAGRTDHGRQCVVVGQGGRSGGE